MVAVRVRKPPAWAWPMCSTIKYTPQKKRTGLPDPLAPLLITPTRLLAHYLVYLHRS